MVNITIYVEGAPSANQDILTIDNSSSFRESFYNLFSQILSPEKFNLIIQPFGSVTRTKNMLKYAENRGMNAVFLIDLDAPKEKKAERIKNYQPFDTTRIFFMIREMEAWILSQVDKIKIFGKNEGLVRKRPNENINNNILLRNRHPEEISKPSQKLDTILRQYFEAVKIRQNKKRKTGKRYLKAKDGPKLIGLLELHILMQCFDEVKRLMDYIEAHGLTDN